MDAMGVPENQVYLVKNSLAIRKVRPKCKIERVKIVVKSYLAANCSDGKIILTIQADS